MPGRARKEQDSPASEDEQQRVDGSQIALQLQQQEQFKLEQEKLQQQQEQFKQQQEQFNERMEKQMNDLMSAISTLSQGLASLTSSNLNATHQPSPQAANYTTPQPVATTQTNAGTSTQQPVSGLSNAQGGAIHNSTNNIHVFNITWQVGPKEIQFDDEYVNVSNNDLKAGSKIIYNGTALAELTKYFISEGKQPRGLTLVTFNNLMRQI